MVEQNKILEIVDMDGDGHISWDEFRTTMISYYTQHDNELVESTFNTLDINGDGFLSSSEIKRVLSSNRNSFSQLTGECFALDLEKFVERCDQNVDG